MTRDLISSFALEIRFHSPLRSDSTSSLFHPSHLRSDSTSRLKSDFISQRSDSVSKCYILLHEVWIHPRTRNHIPSLTQNMILSLELEVRFLLAPFGELTLRLFLRSCCQLRGSAPLQPPKVRNVFFALPFFASRPKAPRL